ncbi:MAG: hypothetical protein P1S60_15905, partial [Anaerolineae bacterium]|nr:hypothetical protein [Anaerolineae bacterium]
SLTLHTMVVTLETIILTGTLIPDICLQSTVNGRINQAKVIQWAYSHTMKSMADFHFRVY